MCSCVWVCLCGVEWGLYHLAGRPGGKVLHHLVHLFKLLGHGLNLTVQLLVLSILVIEHSLVLVPLLLWADAGVLPVETGQETTHFLCLLATFTLQVNVSQSPSSRSQYQSVWQTQLLARLPQNLLWIFMFLWVSWTRITGLVHNFSLSLNNSQIPICILKQFLLTVIIPLVHTGHRFPHHVLHMYAMGGQNPQSPTQIKWVSFKVTMFLVQNSCFVFPQTAFLGWATVEGQ